MLFGLIEVGCRRDRGRYVVIPGLALLLCAAASYRVGAQELEHFSGLSDAALRNRLPEAPEASSTARAAALSAFVQSKTPSPTASASSAQAAAPSSTPATAVLTGVVSDIRGGLIANATVKVTSKDGSVARDGTSDGDGRYTFRDLPLGTYTVTLASPGLQTVVLSDMPVTAGEHFEVPEVPLPVASTKADVEVFASQEQIATEQLHIQELQRVLGVFPNFYTSFVWDAAPLNRRQKFSLMLHATLDPVTFLTTGLIAGAEQARNTFPAYGQGAQGYGKRYGAAYADGFIGRFIGAASLPALFHQDPRYFYMGTGTVKARALHAMSSAVICRSDSGHRQLYYSHILGNFAAGGISNLYHPGRDRGAGLTVSTAVIGLGGSAAVNLIREFALRGLTHKVPAYAQGKPKNDELQQ